MSSAFVNVFRIAILRLVDHIAQQRGAPELDLVLGIGFRSGIRGIVMAHVAGYSDSVAQLEGVATHAPGFAIE